MTRTFPLWKREFDHYPADGPRFRNLAIVVLATISLYFMIYVTSAVAVSVMQHFGMSFGYFAVVAIIGGVAGAMAALAAGALDRWGRANTVAYGLLLVSLVTTFVVPVVPNKELFLLLSAVMGFVEGLMLVASPAMVRDFSPQLGRATAMGLWNTGPVVGSLVVALVASLTLSSSSWQQEIRYAGITGIVVSVIAILGLRDLPARIRNQVIVSTQDRELVEARGAAESPEPGRWRTVLRLDVVLPAVGIAFNLLFYLTMVGNSAVFFSTTHGWSEQQASTVNNWVWTSQALSMIVMGVLSDRLRVRKPFIVAGTIAAMCCTAVFAVVATSPGVSYPVVVFLLVAISVSGSVSYAPWLAGFTENIERHGPAATAVGLAIWGWTTRVITALAAIAIPLVVSGVTPLVEHGKQVAEAELRAAPAQAIVAQHPALFEELSRYPATSIPPDLAARAATEVGAAGLDTVAQAGPHLAVLAEFGPEVARASSELPRQWELWFWTCVAGQLLFLPTTFLIRGRWSPRRARADLAEHEREVSRELNALAQHSKQP